MAAARSIAVNTTPPTSAIGVAPNASNSCGTHVKLFPSAENLFEIFAPKNVTATMATIAMNAIRMPYSARAAPSSPLIKRLILATSTSSNGMVTTLTAQLTKQPPHHELFGRSSVT